MKFLDSPCWRPSRLVTVQPLGDWPIGRDERQGVVDSYGRVYGHPGLLIVDSSIMSGRSGLIRPTPSPRAHRAAERHIEEAS